jgi:hypothetical protein
LQQISDIPVLDACIVVISLVLSLTNVEHLNQNIYVCYLGLLVVVFTPVHIDSITCGSTDCRMMYSFCSTRSSEIRALLFT